MFPSEETEDTFNRHTLLYSVSQFFNNLSRWLDLWCRQKAQCIETQSNSRQCGFWRKLPNFLSLLQHAVQHKALKREDINKKSLPEEVNECKRFLVGLGKENGKIGVFKYAKETLHTVNAGEKLDKVFTNTICVARWIQHLASIGKT